MIRKEHQPVSSSIKVSSDQQLSHREFDSRDFEKCLHREGWSQQEIYCISTCNHVNSTVEISKSASTVKADLSKKFTVSLLVITKCFFQVKLFRNLQKSWYTLTVRLEFLTCIPAIKGGFRFYSSKRARIHTPQSNSLVPFIPSVSVWR